MLTDFPTRTPSEIEHERVAVYDMVLTPEQVKEGRGWLQDCGLPHNENVFRTLFRIEREYEGGIAAFHEATR